MKTVCLTVQVFAKVPEDVDTGALYIDVDTSRIGIMSSAEKMPNQIQGATVTQYETVMTEEVVD